MNHLENKDCRDYINGTPARVFGSETETNSNIFADNTLIDGFRIMDQVFPFDYNRHQNSQLYLTDFVPPKYLISNGRSKATSAVLSTGGELYLDAMSDDDYGVSVLFESATAECLTPEQLRIHEHANLQILVETMGNLATSLDLPKPDVYKRGGYTDVISKNDECLMKENSLGNHENYLMDNVLNAYIVPGRKAFFTSINKEVAGLSTMLVLRKLIDGAGMVAKDNFSISQKPKAFDYSPGHLGSWTSHGDKVPALFAEDRIEIRSGENNKSDWVIEQKFALTSLLIRYIDHESYPEELILADPNQAMSDIASNPWATVQLESGSRRFAPELFREIIHRAREEAEKRGELPEYEADSVEIFDAFYKDLQNISFVDNDVKALAGRVDWAARLDYLYRKGIRHKDITAADVSQVAADLKWDRISDRDIAREHFQKFGHAAFNGAIPGPPETRAKWRVKKAKELFNKGILDQVSWGSVESMHVTGVSQILYDPFATNHYRDHLDHRGAAAKHDDQ